MAWSGCAFHVSSDYVLWLFSLLLLIASSEVAAVGVARRFPAVSNTVQAFFSLDWLAPAAVAARDSCGLSVAAQAVSVRNDPWIL